MIEIKTRVIRLCQADGEDGKVVTCRESSCQLKRILGASNAEAFVSMKLSVYPEQTYIRLEQETTKFAVKHLDKHQVTTILRAEKVN